MIAIRVCPTCKRKFEARVGEPQTYCEECLELKTMSESSVCSWFFDDNDFDDDFDISEAGKEIPYTRFDDPVLHHVRT